MDIVDILSSFGIPAVMGAIIPFLITRHYNKKDENEEKQDNTVDRIDDIEEKINNITEQHEKDNSEFNQKFDVINKLLSVLSLGQQALLRDRIIQMYNYYYIDKKYIPIYARESLDHMFKEYKNLGGNGCIDALVEKLYGLPTELLKNT